MMEKQHEHIVRSYEEELALLNNKIAKMGGLAEQVLGQAIDALTQGPKAKVIPTFDLTIPEGLSRREVEALVKKTSLRGDYVKATASGKALQRARKLGLPKGNRNLEGFLFPATYKLIRGDEVSALVDKQLDAFADEQLAALVVPVDVLRPATGDGGGLVGVERGQPLEQRGAVGRVVLRRTVDRSGQDGHSRPARVSQW